jgi:DNA-binding phage protein
MAADTPTPVQTSTEAWERIELLRRLYRIIDRTSVMEVARQVGMAKASLYRAMWRERTPSYTFLLKLYHAYPQEFAELAILEEDNKREANH